MCETMVSVETFCLNKIARKNQFATAIAFSRYDENADTKQKNKKTILGAMNGCRYRRSADIEDGNIDELKCMQNIKKFYRNRRSCADIGKVVPLQPI